MRNILFTSLLIPAVSLAEVKLDTISVTSKGYSDSLNAQLTDSHVIYIDPLISQQKTIGDILNSLSGVHVASNGGKGQNQHVNIDGQSSANAVILINGQPVGSATLGQASLHLIPVEQVERIEIIKSGGSVLYGSSAMAGVINIVTNQNYMTGGSFATGSYNSKKASFSHSQNINGIVDTGVNWSFEKSDGISARTGNYVNYFTNEEVKFDNDDDGYANHSITAYANLKPTAKLSFDNSVYRSSGTYEYDSKAWDDQATYKNTQINSVLSYAFNNNVTSSIKASRQTDVSSNYGVINSRTDADRFTTISDFASTDVRLKYSKIELLSGVDWRRDYIGDSDLNTNYDDEKNEVLSNFIHASFKPLDSILMSAGSRRDNDDAFGVHLSYSAALQYAINNHSITVSQGSGFKAPTFNDLYYPGSGNPDLDPEESKSKFIRYAYEDTNRNISVKLFRTDLSNLIIWQGMQPSNVVASFIEGSQLNWSEQWNDSISSHFSTEKTIGVNKLDNKRLSYTPEYSSSARITLHGKLNASLEGNFVGVRMDNDRNEQLSPYTTFNLAMTSKPKKNITTLFSIKNIFDREYTPNTTYSSQPLTVMLGLKYEI